MIHIFLLQGLKSPNLKEEDGIVLIQAYSECLIHALHVCGETVDDEKVVSELEAPFIDAALRIVDTILVAGGAIEKVADSQIIGILNETVLEKLGRLSKKGGNAVADNVLAKVWARISTLAGNYIDSVTSDLSTEVGAAETEIARISFNLMEILGTECSDMRDVLASEIFIQAIDAVPVNAKLVGLAAGISVNVKAIRTLLLKDSNWATPNQFFGSWLLPALCAGMLVYIAHFRIYHHFLSLSKLMKPQYLP